MSAYNGLTDVVLSKKRARYLMARNAGEREIFRKKSLLLEEAKTKEEKAFEREKELLIQRHSKILKTQEARRVPDPHGEVNSASKTTSGVKGKNKWEISSDTPLYTQQRRKQGSLLNSSQTLCSSHESILCLSTNDSTGFNREVYHTTTLREDSHTRVRSLSCVLPPIAPFSYTHSAESTTRKQKKSVSMERRNTRVYNQCP